MKSSLLSLFIVGMIAVSCGYSDSSYEVFFTEPIKSKQTNEVRNLKIDTLIFDKVNSSYVGFLSLENDKLCFIDKVFCRVYTFDKQGKGDGWYLGKGNSPKEINTGVIDGYFVDSKSNHGFVGPGMDFHIYNDKYERTKTYRLDNGERTTSLGQIDPASPFHYTPTYRKLIFRVHNNEIFCNVYSEHPNYNFIKNPDEYFENSRIFLRVDKKTGKAISVDGRYSPIYKNYRNLLQFSMNSFDIAENGNIYVCQEADSLMYIYDNKFNVLKAFGFAGKNMNLNYKPISTIKEFKEIAEQDRIDCGYYDFVEYIDERELLFRSYKKGKKSIFDGLQIYNKDLNLMGDIEVPKGFRVIGYVAPYFYSNEFIDEEAQTLKCYKFKL